MSDSFTVVIDIAMADVYHIDVFQCNSVHSSDPIGIGRSLVVTSRPTLPHTGA